MCYFNIYKWIYSISLSLSLDFFFRNECMVMVMRYPFLVPFFSKHPLSVKNYSGDSFSLFSHSQSVCVYFCNKQSSIHSSSSNHFDRYDALDLCVSLSFSLSLSSLLSKLNVTLSDGEKEKEIPFACELNLAMLILEITVIRDLKCWCRHFTFFSRCQHYSSEWDYVNIWNFHTTKALIPALWMTERVHAHRARVGFQFSINNIADVCCFCWCVPLWNSSRGGKLENTSR
jgi:hypothetical protein